LLDSLVVVQVHVLENFLCLYFFIYKKLTCFRYDSICIHCKCKSIWITGYFMFSYLWLFVW